MHGLHTLVLWITLLNNMLDLMAKPERAQIEYLTSHRVARMLSISKKTLHNWVNSGKVPRPPVNPDNGYLLWTMSDIEVLRNILREEQP